MTADAKSLLSRLRQSREPIQVPKTEYESVRELNDMRLIRVIAIEPLFYVCEATA